MVAREVLTSKGQMGALLRAVDWSQTSLGAVSNWGNGLRTAVSLCLNSPLPMAIFWGSDFTLLYNDTWHSILETSQPIGLGRPGREIWSNWEAVQEKLQQVLETGEARHIENQYLRVPKEERSQIAPISTDLISTDPIRIDPVSCICSPIFTESGEVGGVLVLATIDRIARIDHIDSIDHIDRVEPRHSSEIVAAEGENSANFQNWDALLSRSFPHLPSSPSTILGRIPDALIASDRNGRITYLNPAASQMLHQAPEEVYGKLLWEICPTSRNLPFEQECRRSIATQTSIEFEASSSADHWYTVRLYPAPTGLLLFYQNITERKRAEAALSKREEQLRLAQYAASAGLWDWDIAAEQVTWSDSYYALYGYDSTVQPSYAHWMESIVESDRERVDQAVHQALAQQTEYNIEFRIQHPTKGLCWITEIGKTFYDDFTGQPLRMMGIALDITERKQDGQEREHLLQRLETSLGQLEAIINNMSEGLVVADLQGRILTLNPAALAMHGFDRLETQCQIQSFTETIEVFDSEGQLIAFEDWPISRALRGETFANYEVELHHRDTGRVWVGNFGGTPVYDKNEDMILAIVTIRDVTARRQAQQELARSLQAEQAAREQAEVANRIKDEFLAVLSHELRSPLNPILGWSQLLRSRRLDEQTTKQALAAIERNAKLQTQLIDDLLDVSRILRGKLLLNHAPVNLVSTIEGAIETVRLAAEAKGIPIQTRLDANVGQVAGDATRLQQVVWNLVSNAVKFTPTGGNIEVRLERKDSFAQIQVKDTGRGINPEFLPHLFEYFRQEDSATTRSFGGLGLGLAIVRHLTELHGGTVFAESAGEGRGTTITVQLPLMPSEAQSRHNLNDASAQTHNLLGVQALIVDDEPDIQDLVQFVLEQAGATVRVAASAQAALNQIAQQIPDVLICDIGMPEMDGYMLIQQIRTAPGDRHQHIPAIALTAYAAEADQQRALAAGFQQHLSKPVEPEELVRAISELLKRNS